MKSNGFSERYDEVRAAALAAGVCPRVMNTFLRLAELHACGRPLQPGKLWCWMHAR